jgi:hypothetical protein
MEVIDNAEIEIHLNENNSESNWIEEHTDDIESQLLDKSSAELCRICYEDDTIMVELPCHHHLCEICKSKLKKKECPFCRQPFIVNTSKLLVRRNTNSNNDNDEGNSSQLCRVINTILVYTLFLIMIYLFLFNK